MSDFPESLGTVAEGGLLAQAVEPKTGETAGDRHDGPCLNCGAELIGPHCHNCGQKAQVHRTIGAFMHDLVHGALHFEGKIWRTLPLLAWKPGELTRRYIEGERARFVSPMALFLFAVFLMFASFQLAGISTPTEFETPEGLPAAAQTAGAQLEEERDAAQAALDGMDADAPERAAAEERLANARTALDALDGAQKIALDETGNAKMTIEPSGIEWLDKGLGKWRSNPGLMLYKLQTNFYKFSWLLIPLSVPFVWLLFAWKRRFKGYDHAVFVTYSLAFMSLLLIAVTFAGLAGAPAGAIVPVVLLVPPLHLYRQLRGTYGLSRFSAFWRLAVLSVFVVVILGLFLQALLVMGLF